MSHINMLKKTDFNEITNVCSQSLNKQIKNNKELHNDIEKATHF